MQGIKGNPERPRSGGLRQMKSPAREGRVRVDAQ
jgi:hypothetical protein